MTMIADDNHGPAQPKRARCDTVPKIEMLSGWFCPYAQRAWIALEEKRKGNFILTEAMEIQPKKKMFVKTPYLLEKNPYGKLPVVIDRSSGDDEVVVYESLICVEYIDEAFGNNGPKLLPGSPAQRAQARMWTDKLNNEICSQFYVLLLRQDIEEQEKAAAKILNGIREFSKHCKGPYFYGNDFSIVDIAIAPWIVGIRMEVLKHYRGFEVPKDKEYAKYREFIEAVSKRPSFLATASTDLPAMLDVYLPYSEGEGYGSVVKES